MRNAMMAMVFGIALFLTACASAPASSTGAAADRTASGPKVTAPETSVNFGDLPVTEDMRNVRTKRFTIRNEGSAAVTLGKPQVLTREGC